MVASRPPSATASIALEAPPGAAFAAASTPRFAVVIARACAGQSRVVVVDHVARPERGYPLPAGRARRRDDPGAAQRGQGDEQPAGDPAGPVDEELLAGADVERIAEDLLGGERGHREGGRGLPAGTPRFPGEQPGRGDQPGRPRPLVPQWHRIGDDRIAGHPCLDVALLLVSELVTNSSCTVGRRWRAGRLR